MATLDEGEFRTVIEDARARHAAVISLLYATDAQAISLLRLYVTLGIATASAAAAGLGPSAFVSRPIAWAMAATTIVFVVGAAFCLRALRATAINLPGRKADFWKWSLRPDVDRAAILNAYLDNLETKGAANDAANAMSANALKWAKRCGAIAPLIAIGVGAATTLYKP